MLTKAELSQKVLEFLEQEMPMETLTRGSEEEARQYIDVITDAMTAVVARMTVAYIATAIANNPLLDEDEISQMGDLAHIRLSFHLDAEAADLMEKLEERFRFDA